MIKRKLISSV